MFLPTLSLILYHCMQSIVKGAEDRMPSEKIDQAMKMARDTGKALAHCFREVFRDDDEVSISTIVSPSEGVPEIAKRSEQKRR